MSDELRVAILKLEATLAEATLHLKRANEKTMADINSKLSDMQKALNFIEGSVDEVRSKMDERLSDLRKELKRLR